MEREIVIFIVNKQKINDEQNSLKFISRGTYKEENGKYLITYQEVNPELNYKEGDLCFINVESQDLVIITKIGSIKTKLILEKGKRHYSQYQTENGMLSMGFYTKSIEFKHEKKSAFLRLEYSMDINSSTVSENEVCIKVKEN